MSDNILVHGVDFSAMAVGTGADLNNLIDASTLAANRGVIITYTDNLTPPTTIPNADVITDYKKYLLKRTTLANLVYWYYWDDAVADDATYHKWVDLNTIANNAHSDAAAAQVSADAAFVLATTAYTDVGNLETRVDAIETANNTIPIGCIFPSLATTIPDGYLVCNGLAFKTALYPLLYNAIGTTYGTSGGDPLLPNLQGRILIGEGMAAGLTTTRTLGDQTLGAETSIDVSLPAHYHTIDAATSGSFVMSKLTASVDGVAAGIGGYPIKYSINKTDSNAAISTPFSIIPPCAVVKWLIKAR